MSGDGDECLLFEWFDLDFGGTANIFCSVFCRAPRTNFGSAYSGDADLGGWCDIPFCIPSLGWFWNWVWEWDIEPMSILVSVSV